MKGYRTLVLEPQWHPIRRLRGNSEFIEYICAVLVVMSAMGILIMATIRPHVSMVRWETTPNVTRRQLGAGGLLYRILSFLLLLYSR